MSNQAYLFAEDSPAPFDPLADDRDEASIDDGRTFVVAGASYQLPAFWLFGFSPEHVVTVESGESVFTTLVAPLDEVRKTLRARDPLARKIFSAHAGVWSGWRQAIDAIERSHLKLDAYEVSMLYDDEAGFGDDLRRALRWFESRSASDFEALLRLAGVEDFDATAGTVRFDARHAGAERYLIGAYEPAAPRR